MKTSRQIAPRRPQLSIGHAGSACNPNAFTLIELLVVIAVLAVLGALFLPVMVKAKGKSMSMSAQCLNNQKQLITAAIMYADDNQDWGMPNMPGYIPVWCAGTMNFNAGNTETTNPAL